MASKLKISIEAEVAKARAELETIRNSIDKMKDSQSKANNTFSNFLKGGKFLVGAKLAYEAVKKITKAVKEMVEAYRETELANARLSGILRATGRATEFAGGKMGQMADELSRLSTFSTTEITNAQALLLVYDNIGNDTFPDVLKSAMDLSAAFGTDLSSSVQRLGRALNDPATGFTRLRGEGIALSKEKENLINILMDENDLFGAQKILLDELKDRYGGLSEEIAKTSVSKMDRLKDTLEDIKGEFGRKLLSDGDHWLDAGINLADAFLNRVKEANDLEAAKKKALEPIPEEEDPTTFRKYADYSMEQIDELIGGFEAQIQEALEHQRSQKPSNILGKPVSDEKWEESIQEKILTNTNYAPIFAALKLLYDEKGIRQEAEEAEALVQAIFAAGNKRSAEILSNIASQSDAYWETLGLKQGGANKGKTDIYNEPTFFERVMDALEEFGGTHFEIFSLEEENERIEEILRKLKVELEGVSEDSVIFTEEEREYAQLAIEGLAESLEKNKKKIRELKNETTEWDEALSYILKNEDLITYSLEEKVAELEKEIQLNTQLLNDEEAKNHLTDKQLDSLRRIVESKEKQLEVMKDEVSGLKDARDFISQNKHLIDGTAEERMKAIDAQIDYNTELLKTVGLTTAERKELEDILNLLKEQKKEAEGGGFGSETWGSIVSDWGKDSAYGDFISKLTTEINALEQAFGNTFSTIQGLAVSLGDAILDSMRTALTEIEKTLREKTELYEEKEREERGIRDESLNALQEQYDADAISYEEFMDRKQEIDDLYDENTKDALDAMTEAEEEAARKRDELARKEFEANKRNSIANALINGAMAVVRAFSDLGPIAGAIAGATIGALTTAQVAIIGQQSYVPALAEGGVATGPTLAMIGEGREPELVLPLSKAKQFGFGGSGQQIIVRVENNTIYGIDDFGERAYEAIRSAQRVGRVPRNAF